VGGTVLGIERIQTESGQRLNHLHLWNDSMQMRLQ
jgi:hypothetical protein